MLRNLSEKEAVRNILGNLHVHPDGKSLPPHIPIVISVNRERNNPRKMLRNFSEKEAPTVPAPTPPTVLAPAPPTGPEHQHQQKGSNRKDSSDEVVNPNTGCKPII